MKRWINTCCLMALFIGFALNARAADTVFTTEFETTENYDPGFELVGQNGWEAEGTAGNGLLAGFPGEGQAAYIGYYDPLTNTEAYFTTWKPINFDPLASGRPVVTFRTTMAIVDSTTADPNRDTFRWSVYNSDTQHLLSLDFDNDTTGICYLLGDETNFHATDFIFTNDVIYDIEIRMNFVTDKWSAWVGATQVITNQPIATSAVKRDIGDIAATWDFLNANGPGDNAMIFDNYTILAEDDTPIAPTLRLVSLLSGGEALMELTGEPFRTYVIDATVDFVTWTPVKTNTPTDGILTFLDTNAVGMGMRSYRARLP